MERSSSLQEHEEAVTVGLDIGSAKISAVVGRLLPDGRTEIMGYASEPSRGLRNGVITDIGAVSQCIRRVIDECNRKSGREIHSAYVGIAGQHIESVNREGAVTVSGSQISQSDVNRVIEYVCAHDTGRSKTILHILPQEFRVDDEAGIKEPIGMAGKRLGAGFHIVSGSSTVIANIQKSCHQAGLHIEKLVAVPLASAQSVFSSKELDMGGILLDIGGGTTDMIVYRNGSVIYSSILPLGGWHITNDISIGLKVPLEVAEKVKLEKAVAWQENGNPSETFSVPERGRGHKVYECGVLLEIVEARCREILESIAQIIRGNGFEANYTSGVALTGGTSLMKGLDLLAEEIFGMPVKVVGPTNISGFQEFVASPIYSTSVGLVNYGLNEESDERLPIKADNPDSGIKRLIDKMRQWV